MVRIFKILNKTTSEGPGKRFCIWVQGCNKHCPGCYAKETWDFNSGTEYSIEELYHLILKEKDDIEGVTFLGGEPFEQANDLSKLAHKVKNDLKLSVICFSGYTYKELKNKKDKYINQLLKNTDILIDGGFDKDKFDLSRPWIGSSNQKYIFLTNRYSYKEILSIKNKIEIRIQKNGKLDINGMGNFNEIETKFYLQLGQNNVK